VTGAVGLRVTGAALLACVALLLSSEALASRWQVRQEVREGKHEVSRERREARREIRREVREDYYDRYYRGEGRWYRDGRYWDRYEYEGRYYRRRDRDGDEFLKGALVGAAVVGVAVAVAKSDDD
jgi:hypothetical protein